MDWVAVAEFAVGPHGVVLDQEVLDDDAGLGQRPHLLPIEALIAESGSGTIPRSHSPTDWLG